MAPLLKSLYRPSQRSLLSSLFTATFLGAVVVVAFPCPVRPPGFQGTMLDGDGNDDVAADQNSGLGLDKRRMEGRGEVVVLMNKRGRRFLEES